MLKRGGKRMKQKGSGRSCEDSPLSYEWRIYKDKLIIKNMIDKLNEHSMDNSKGTTFMKYGFNEKEQRLMLKEERYGSKAKYKTEGDYYVLLDYDLPKITDLYYSITH